jgi:hypothetical protein
VILVLLEGVRIWRRSVVVCKGRINRICRPDLDILPVIGGLCAHPVILLICCFGTSRFYYWVICQS